MARRPSWAIVSVAVVAFALSNAWVASAATNIWTLAGGGSLTGPAAEGAYAPDVSFEGAVLDVDAIGEGRDFITVDPTCSVRRVSVTSEIGLPEVTIAAPQGDTGSISTVAGIGTCSSTGPVTDADPLSVGFDSPCCIAATNDGGVGGFIVADTDNGMVHRWSAGNLTTVAGDGTCDATPPANGSPALSAQLCRVRAVDHHPATSGRFLLVVPALTSAGGDRVYEVAGGNITRVAGGGCAQPPNPTPTQLCLSGVGDLAYVPGGNTFLLSDFFHSVVWLIDPAASVATIVAGTSGVTGGTGDGGSATAATLTTPLGVATTLDGGFVVADAATCRVRRVAPVTNIITTIAGRSPCSGLDPPGDGGPATDASLFTPRGVAAYSGGLLIAEFTRPRVRLVDRTSLTSVPAGPLHPDVLPSLDVSFDYVGAEPSPNFTCGITGELGKPGQYACPGGHTDLELYDGRFAFHVFDEAPPRELGPAQFNFTIDTTPPAAFALREPAAEAVGVALQPTFSWDAATDSPAASGIERYELSVDGAIVGTVEPGSCSETCSLQAPGPLSEGAHTWQVRVLDRAAHVRDSETRRFDVGGLPTAAFSIAPNPALAGRVVTFDAGPSSDSSGIVRYEWDLDGDGAFEVDAGPASTTERRYDAPTTVAITLRVTDGPGATATTTQTLRVNPAPEAGALLGVSINAGARYTKSPAVTLSVKRPASASSIVVSNDGGFFGLATFAPAATIPWRLDSSGPERLPKIVYLRFLLGPIVSETYIDDIILDERRPTVTHAAVAPAAGSARAAKVRRWRVRVKARDLNSGVQSLQITARKRRPGRLIPYKTRLAVKSAARPRFVRARDRAGNLSRWKRAR